MVLAFCAVSAPAEVVMQRVTVGDPGNAGKGVGERYRGDGPGRISGVAAPASVCGDGVIELPETCDDGNTVGDDGCSAACAVEDGHVCVGEPSLCGPDCNENGLPDACDLSCTAHGGLCALAGCGLSDDCNTDGAPDACGVEVACDATETEKLTASDTTADLRLGRSLSVSGDTAVVGAFDYSCAAADVCGAAYVYRLHGTGWVEEQKLAGPDEEHANSFGRSVCVSGDTAVVGGGGHCAGGLACGAAHIYRFNGTSWIDEQRLTASDPAAGTGFGWSVAVSGDTVVVGAENDDCAAGWNCGAAYVFRFDGESWIEQQKLTASDAGQSDNFGVSVSVSGDTIVVGAEGDRCAAGTHCGAAYVFRFNGEGWIEEQKLSASDAADHDLFGHSVSVSGNTAVVGAFSDDCAAGFGCGAAYVFDLTDADCNCNGEADTCDINAGISEDCDLNSVPDECDVDCNQNAAPDACDILDGTSSDCDANAVPDECQLDSDGDDTPDECDVCPGLDDRVDHDGDGIPDCVEMEPVPTISAWGALVLALLLLCGAKVVLGARRAEGTA